jgi:WD40 repeat protein
VESRIASGWFVSYSPDGSLIAGSDGSEGVDTAIWDADTGELIHVLAAPEGRWMVHPAFSPDGRHLVVPYEPMDFETDQAGPVAVVWDVVTGEPAATFGGPDAGVGGNFATFNPDGTMLAVNTDGSLVVWDMASGTERYRIAHTEAYSPRHSFSPDGTLLALPMISDDPLLPSRVVLHDALTGMEIDSFDVGELRPPTTAFDPSGRRLAALSDWPPGLMVWDVASGETVLSVTLEGQQSELAWSPDGNLIAVAGTEGVPRLLDAATGDEVLFLLGHDTAIYSLAFSPDGERLAAAGENTDTLVWDITATGSREVATLATPYSYLGKMRYDADGNNLLLITTSPTFAGSLLQLDATTGEIVAEIPDQLTGYPLQVRLIPEAGLVATLNVDGTAALHDSQTFEPVATLPEGYFALDVSRDGTRVVLRELGQSADRTGLWETPEAIVAEVGTWETLATIGTGSTYYARFSPDGNLVTGYGHVGVFDIEAQTYLATPDEFSMIAANWSPDGSFLAARTRGGRLGLVDVAALRDGATFAEALVFDIDAHDGLIQDPVLFNRDGSLIATWGNIDRHFKVWSTEDGQLVADLGERDWQGFDFHPNGRHLITGGPDGTLRILTLDTTELLDIARSRLTRSFTDDECVTYYIDPCPDLQAIRGG